MTATPMQLLDRFGPTRCEPMTVADARKWCRELAASHYENFSVLSWLVPADLREDFAAVYAFCRWADDLGDETGDAARSSELLAWWRGELQRTFADTPQHPVFIALKPTITKFDLPIEPFDNLIHAFELDQVQTRYETWDQLLQYCRYSANPVGRLVLMLFREPRNEEILIPSDRICTALQITNHLQDIRRDILDRNRVYLPSELYPNDTFLPRLIDSARKGWGVDQQIFDESRHVVCQCVDRTWKLYEDGEPLISRISPQARPIIDLLGSGGCHVLRQIERWNYETALHRPKLGRITRTLLIVRAWWHNRSAR